MRRMWSPVLLLCLLAVAGLRAAEPADSSEKKFEDFDKVVKGAKVYEGLFKLHHKDDTVYAEIKQQQFDQPLLSPMAIARGAAMGGLTLNFEEQWVLVFRRVGDKVHLVRRNVRFKATPGSAVARAVETTYTDSVLLALPIVSLNQREQSVLINLNDIYMSNFAQVPFGGFDRNRSTWHKVKAFPRNIELEVAATFTGGGIGDSVIDSRGNTVILHYGLAQLPDSGYQPRLADDRVGYFLSVTKDFSNDERDSDFLRHVNRWRMERSDNKNKNKPSVPKKKIVFWIENSVPEEYRAAVREGILEWNKAFEKVGFLNAIEVRQQEDEEFDPEDIRYSTFRWITTGEGYAMGPSRANPLTGEILDADIVFDADMIRYWKQEYHSLHGGTTAEPVSMIRAFRRGWGLLDMPLAGRTSSSSAVAGWNDRATPEARRAAQRWAVQQGLCQCCSYKRAEVGLAAMALATRAIVKPGEPVPDELLQQAVKETVMHEVGHTLGLRHNFKASTMLKGKELHDTAITRARGLSGSVMDYNPVNLAPKGTKQGDYFSTTLGPYDYWAIEYAYKPLDGGTTGERSELAKIANRGATPGHDFGTDEDMYVTPDPLINVWDLGDPMEFSRERIALAQELLANLADKVVTDGEGYQRTRQAFDLLLRQYGDAAFLLAAHVGGAYVHRDHRGDPNGRDPYVPVAAAKQREALKLLRENLLTDRPFQFPPELLRRLATERWTHWGTSSFNRAEYPVNERVLGIQSIVLDELFNGSTLARVQNNALQASKGEEPVTVAEIFRAVTDGVWTEMAAGKAGDKMSSSVVRRNLQREHLKRLATIVLGSRNGGGLMFLFFDAGAPTPPDARSLARLHLKEIAGKINTALKAGADDTTRAHLEECKEQIAKVLAAGLQVQEP